MRTAPERYKRLTSRRCIMRDHDLVSDRLLALTAAGLMLLCSGLLAFAFG